MRFRDLAGAVALLLITTRTARAQQPRLALTPRQPSGGTLAKVTIDRIAISDRVVAVTGTMAGEPLHFLDAGSGKYQALGAVPVDVSDSVVALARVERESGRIDTLRLLLRYPHHAPPPPPAPVRGRVKVSGARRLRVDARFTRPMDAETSARVEHENELAREVGRKSQDTPQLWTLPFLKPRPAKITSGFGSGRVFNGRLSSSHLGIDYRGLTGEPIYAANRGVVALVSEFFLAGNVVYIDHGDGVITGYFHMSQTEVAAGDTVERGQEIGRVTGPHLHWSARFGALTIDPADLLALGPPFVDRTPARAHGNQ